MLCPFGALPYTLSPFAEILARRMVVLRREAELRFQQSRMATNGQNRTLRFASIAA
jgi:hypothetical protein